MIDFCHTLLSRNSHNVSAACTTLAAAILIVLPASSIPNPLTEMESEIEKIAREKKSFVVSIISEKRMDSESRVSSDAGTEEVEEGTIRYYRRIGSGIVWDTLGHIITHLSVIQGADDITVVFADASRHPARIVGVDPLHKIAVLSSEKRFSAILPIGDSRKLELGNIVILIGNSYGYEPSISFGIISGRNRTISIGREIMDGLLQMNMAVHPGDSGGALFNSRGEIVAIVSANFSPLHSRDISFALPIDRIGLVADRLIRDGTVRYGYLGVGIKDVPCRRISGKKIPRDGWEVTREVRVFEVEPGSPAALAGIMTGDMITGYGNEEVDDASELKQLVLSTIPKTMKRIEIFRPDTMFTMEVAIGEKTFPSPAQTLSALDVASSKADARNPRHGEATIDSLWKEIEELRTELNRVRRSGQQKE